MHGGVGVQLVDQLEQIGLAGLGRQSDDVAVHAGRSDGVLLVADVDPARRVVADQHDRQPRDDPRVDPELQHFEGQLFANPLRQAFSIENRSSQMTHSPIMNPRTSTPTDALLCQKPPRKARSDLASSSAWALAGSPRMRDDEGSRSRFVSESVAAVEVKSP